MTACWRRPSPRIGKDEAQALYREILSVSPAHFDALHMLGVLHAQRLLQHMDLVVTVDTVVAHLAAALGRPVWLLLPFVPDWRWLLDRDDSPWYPTVRLFRQPRFGDWRSVIDRITHELPNALE